MLNNRRTITERIDYLRKLLFTRITYSINISTDNILTTEMVEEICDSFWDLYPRGKNFSNYIDEDENGNPDINVDPQMNSEFNIGTLTFELFLTEEFPLGYFDEDGFKVLQETKEVIIQLNQLYPETRLEVSEFLEEPLPPMITFEDIKGVNIILKRI